MPQRSTLFRVVRASLLVLAVLLTLVWLALRRADDFYSSRYFLNTSAQARERGVLVHVPAVQDSLIAGTNPPSRLLATWIQEDHRIKHPLLFGRRIVGMGTFTLVVETTGPTRYLAVIAHAKPDGSIERLRLSSESRSRFGFEIAPPFPDSIVLIGAER